MTIKFTLTLLIWRNEKNGSMAQPRACAQTQLVSGHDVCQAAEFEWRLANNVQTSRANEYYHLVYCLISESESEYIRSQDLWAE